ncbi:fungal transcriptional regulatory [Fusarium denticulatum]|uniref:Fungal transcriptional regulatory n=1 Tax=Fusarium denticulatum TaxID=48507 RepID=A0A8H5XKE5_9HYPO|nr:fungal transcriptional regulatory [Fusarium denticulatum]
MPRRKGKGCSICSKRRIICDLGRPSCQKCLGRGFTCPGYGPRLRWVQGVALRGHLRGVQFPIPKSPASTSPTSLDSNTQQLLDYYDKNIAGLMVWIDSEKNYYRTKVLPLAQTNEAVRLAICAVSAQHAARDFTPSSVYEKDRDHVLSMIMRGVDDMTAHPQLTVTADTAEWMLSSMMVLSSYELAHTGGADAADFHRKAARALVNTLSTVDFPKSSLFSFLQNQLAMYDIFACTTILDATDVQDAIRPVEYGDDRSFSAFLLLLHDATLMSRGSEAQDSTRPWRSEFVQARGETLMEIGSSGVCSSAGRADFIRLVDAYHNAALLYTARCLGHEYGPEETVGLFDLFRLLTSMENLHACIHNLAWPIFIAGTECYEDDDRQIIIRDLYQSLSVVTGFKHHGDVLNFLETFWSGGNADWRILAKKWEGLGRRILAV